MEREIRELLIEVPDPEKVARILHRKYEILDCSLPEMETLGVFFLKSGFASLYCELCLKKLEAGSVIAWGHFGQALQRSCPQIPPNIRRALFLGSEEQK